MKFPISGLTTLFIVLLICICGCTQFSEEMNGEPQGRITGLTWYLVSVSENGSPGTIVNGTTITALFDGNGTLSGSAGCNQYTAPYTGLPEKLAVGQPSATKINCGSPDGIMIQESRYLSTVQQSSAYTLRDNTLEILDGQGETLLIYTAVSPELLSTWRIITFGTSGGEMWTPGTLTTITLRFHPDGNISGNAGCNDYLGTYRITGMNSLTIHPSGMTKMFCGIGGVMELEHAYSGYLPEMQTYSLSDGRLFMSDTTGNIRMLFDKKPS
ncbi:MAG: META domain-containing protein [Methanoregulaceae archaeon]|nr:META domain-containing protein [Methanoregulaceae archaeon]